MKIRYKNKNDVKSAPVNWVKVNDNMSSYLNERQFLKIFPENADQLRLFIRKEGLKLDKREDNIKLGIYCNELLNGLK